MITNMLTQRAAGTGPPREELSFILGRYFLRMESRKLIALIAAA
jgi:hypothetical protein